jgi:hypothetical protein
LWRWWVFSSDRRLEVEITGRGGGLVDRHRRIGHVCDEPGRSLQFREVAYGFAEVRAVEDVKNAVLSCAEEDI